MSAWIQFDFHGATPNQKIINAAGLIQDGKMPGILVFHPDKGWSAARIVHAQSGVMATTGMVLLAEIHPYRIFAVDRSHPIVFELERRVGRESPSP